MKADWDNPKYDNGIAFLDMLFNYLLAFAMLFILALLLIRPPTPTDAAVKLRAEFMLTMTWPDGSIDDIDLWLMLPDGRKVNFIDRDVEFVTLDRDDRGAANDFYTDGKGGRQLTRMNREIMTIRAIVPGRYVVSAHVFSARNDTADSESGTMWRSDTPLPFQAQLEIVKLNPSTSEVLKSTVLLSEHGQEVVFVAFDIDEAGNVTLIDRNPSKYKIVDLSR